MVCIEKCLHFKRKCRHHPHPILDILPVYLTRGISYCGWCNKFVIQKNHLSAKIELFRLLFNERKGDFNGKSNKFYGTYKMDV